MCVCVCVLHIYYIYHKHTHTHTQEAEGTVDHELVNDLVNLGFRATYVTTCIKVPPPPCVCACVRVSMLCLRVCFSRVAVFTKVYMVIRYV